jgi:threonine aldolase
VTIAPLALSAEHAFDRNLSKMRAYREKAIAVAARIATIDGIDIVPNPPQTNTFHVFLRGEKETLEERAHAYARERGTFVFARLAPTPNPAMQKWEFVAGDASLEVELDEFERALRAVVSGT